MRASRQLETALRVELVSARKVTLTSSQPMATDRSTCSVGRAYLEAPVDAASLAVFRCLFGTVMCIAAVRFIAKGWVYSQLVDPPFHFSYPHCELVRPATRTLMLGLFVLLAVAGVGLTLGLRARLCALILAVGWAYVELIDRANYLNHYYLACLLAALLACTPAGLQLSVDAWLCPARRCTRVPRWLLWVLRFQVAVVYIFAGVAKLNDDWLLHAQPLRIWLAAPTSALPWIAGVGTELAYAASWLGAAFDLALVPALLWKRTRCFALAGALAFHLLTAALLPIGMFPWIMLASVTLLLPPDWPRMLPGVPPCPSGQLGRPPTAVRVALTVHCAVQLLVPLCQHTFARDSAWTYEGFDFAWKVMLAEKSGSVRFRVRDRTSAEDWEISPSNYLSPVQEHALGQDPRLIIAFARHLARELREQTGRDVAVFAEAFATLNGRPLQRLIDPTIDLTQATLPDHVIVKLHDHAARTR